MSQQPFKRLNIILQAAQALVDASGNVMSMQTAMLAQGPYISRGKGRSIMKKAPTHKHMSSVRAAKKLHNIKKRKAA